MGNQYIAEAGIISQSRSLPRAMEGGLFHGRAVCSRHACRTRLRGSIGRCRPGCRFVLRGASRGGSQGGAILIFYVVQPRDFEAFFVGNVLVGTHCVPSLGGSRGYEEDWKRSPQDRQEKTPQSSQNSASKVVGGITRSPIPPAPPRALPSVPSMMPA